MAHRNLRRAPAGAADTTGLAPAVRLALRNGLACKPIGNGV